MVSKRIRCHPFPFYLTCVVQLIKLTCTRLLVSLNFQKNTCAVQYWTTSNLTQTSAMHITTSLQETYSANGWELNSVIIQQMPSVFNLCLLEKYGLMTIYWKYYIRSYILRTSHVNQDNSAIGMQVLASGFFIQMYFFW